MVSPSPPSLTPTEWQMMCAVWELKEADAIEVSSFLCRKWGRSYPAKTAGILLSRLAKKGYLRITPLDPAGRGRPAHLYSPAIDREEALHRQFAKFVQDYFLEDADLNALRTLGVSNAGGLIRKHHPV